MFAEWFTVQIDGAFIAAITAAILMVAGALANHRKKEIRTVTAVVAAKGSLDERALRELPPAKATSNCFIDRFRRCSP